jgi:hypothetical protein
MQNQNILSDLVVELSIEEQQLLSGGRYRWCRRPYKPHYGRGRPYYGNGDGHGSPFYRC